MKLHLILVLIVLTALACLQAPTASCPHPHFSKLISFQYLYQTGNVPNGTIVETYEIKYRSDGLMITGYLSKPEGDLQLPAILYLRGGNRDFGTIDQTSLDNQRKLAAEGFVILSTQLRGNIFSQGRDEFGGKDINDILQLIEIAKDLNFVDTQRIGVHGKPRGGGNAYKISKLSNDIKAISVTGSSVDIRDSHSYRPDKYSMVHLPIIGDTLKYKAEYDKRSAIKWVKEINEPVLILHGTDDQRSKIQYIHKMIDSLTHYNKTFEHHFIEGGNHALGSHRELRDSLIVDWYKRKLK